MKIKVNSASFHTIHCEEIVYSINFYDEYWWWYSDSTFYKTHKVKYSFYDLIKEIKLGNEN
jgi:hypothetical protein